MKLYSHPFSNNCRRVLVLIEELGLDDVEVVQVELGKGEQQQPEYLAINPNGKVPALVDGDLTLWESMAIMHHLAQGTSLEPKGGDLVEVIRWQSWDLAHFGPNLLKVVWERVVKPMRGAEPDETLVEAGLKGVARFAPVLDAQLVDKDFVVGDSLSLADITLATNAALAAPARVDLDAYPNIQRWLAGIADRPSMQKTALRM
ncbi:MAG: glutathione S-transferase family protein [Deltaproteobacteria bacterium]|nr:glutathione S-transferase family protein [Deltaproteobacteria bacterium]